MDCTQSRWLVLAICGLTAGLGASEARADDEFVQHTAATMTCEITSETFATTPANTSRTTLGIGELVECSIDFGTWVDKDCNVTQHRVDNDEIGSAQWACSGGGTVEPTAAGPNDSCILTAYNAPCFELLVQVTVRDTGEKYVDEAIVKYKTFEVIEPNGQNTAHLQDTPLTGFTEDEDGPLIGADTLFTATLTSTTPVNFQRAVIAENIPKAEWTWPDDTAGSYGPYNHHDKGSSEYREWTLQTLNESNQWTDRRNFFGPPYWDRDYLDGLSGSFHIPLTIHMEYLHEAGFWAQFFDGANDNGDQGFQYSGPTDVCRAKMKGSGGDAVGNWQGPWVEDEP